MNWPELPSIVGGGVLFWLFGSGLQVWGQQGVSAGVAALVLGTTPLWGALYSAASPRTLVGLCCALGGLAAAAEGDFDMASVGALVLAAIVGAWAGAGASGLRSDVLWVAAIQLGVGGAGQLAAMALFDEALPTPSGSAWFSWAWLVLGPAVLGMVAYVHAARSLPLTVVLTYAVVNPLVALLVGWLALSEPLGIRQLTGLVLVGIGLLPVLAPARRSRMPLGLGPSSHRDRHGSPHRRLRSL